MAKIFNTTADCKPDLHYMVNIHVKLAEIKKMIDRGDYFTINRARQYGKTTTLRTLNRFLQKDRYVVFLDFQLFGTEEFRDENTFAMSFARAFLRGIRRNERLISETMDAAILRLDRAVNSEKDNFRLYRLFEYLSDICAVSDGPIVLMIDEVDSASNNQVFLDFLAQLRGYYINRDCQPTFQSVILAGVHDIRNLRRKLRPEDDHKVNSPWNIAADFKVDMSFSAKEIAGMLYEYESDYHTGMDVDGMAQRLHAYTSGYPFLVSRLCKLLDEEIFGREGFETREQTWTKAGFDEAVKLVLTERNMLFESLSEKLISYPE